MKKKKLTRKVFSTFYVGSNSIFDVGKDIKLATESHSVPDRIRNIDKKIDILLLMNIG
jgi:hypothetical protein